MQLRVPEACTMIFTDASDVAFGGFTASLDGATVSSMWTSEDAGKSSTYRKLKAIYYIVIFRQLVETQEFSLTTKTYQE